MLSITNLTKKYRNSDKYAVEDVTFDVKDGEIFGFLGPNGAGKSTTIKCVTGILPYESGCIKVCGNDIKENPVKAKMNIGYVSDNHMMYERLTAREYINFMADMYGVGLEDRRKRAEELLETFSLTQDYDRQISSYSHGMKQKICVIGALIHRPKLWILDEPMTGLDPKSSYTLKTLMREYCEEGNSVFFSSHMLEVAEKVCDRIGIIDGGKMLTVTDIDSLGDAKREQSLEQFFLSVTGAAEEVTFDETPAAAKTGGLGNKPLGRL